MKMTEQEAINQDGEEIIEEFDSYAKNFHTQKAFGVSSNGEEGYPNFFDFAFTWKWKLLLYTFAVGLLTVMTVGVINCGLYVWRVIESIV